MTAKATVLSFLGLGIAFAGCTSFEDELPESCVVIEEVKTTPPNKVVIDTKMEVRSQQGRDRHQDGGPKLPGHSDIPREDVERDVRYEGVRGVDSKV